MRLLLANQFRPKQLISPLFATVKFYELSRASRHLPQQINAGSDEG
jgi:hypothetical protein